MDNAKWLFSDDDARMYLQDCIFTVDGRPVKVDTASKAKCACTDLLTGEALEANVGDLHVIGSPGNVIVDERYYYTERRPRRQARRSLNQAALYVSQMPWGGERNEVRAASVGVGNAIIKQYPSFKDALNKVMTGKCVAVPFHCDWGVGRLHGVPYLLYKDTPVGAALEEKIKIFTGYFFLKERLLEALNHELV